MKEVAEEDIPVDAPAAPPIMDVEDDLTDANLLPSQREKGIYLHERTYVWMDGLMYLCIYGWMY